MENVASDRAAAPAVDDKAALIARNKAALAKRKADIAAKKEAEASAALPAGWRRVESNSRPGEFVFENEFTEERQGWFPDGPAKQTGSAIAEKPMTEKEKLIAKNKAALQKRKDAQKAAEAALASQEPPAGWKRVESNSRPGEFVYENLKNGERQAWFPDAPAFSEEEMAKQKLIEKNKAALAKRKSAVADAAKAQAAADAAKPLPEGWTRVESRSRPGEFVYENTKTGERQAWFPETVAADALPEGWRKVESRTYPGEYVYENIHTLERQAWEPTTAAPMTEGAKVEPPADAEAKEPDVIGTGKAAYDFEPTNLEEEIQMLEGDQIDIHYKAENGWWVGKNKRTNRVGIFPGTYLE